MLGTDLGAQTIVYMAGAFYIAGLIVINQMALRFLVLAGTIFYLIYYFNVADEPLWEAVYISSLILTANIIGIVSLLAKKSRFAIPKAHADIYPLMPLLPPGDFRALMKHASRYSLKETKKVTTEGMPGSKLYFVISGSPEVHKGESRFTLPPHVFLGEVAFLIDDISSASAWLPEGAEVLEWQFSDLRHHADRNLRFRLALDAVLSVDLARKVATGIAPSAYDPPNSLVSGGGQLTRSSPQKPQS